jgi:hypothetical protein
MATLSEYAMQQQAADGYWKQWCNPNYYTTTASTTIEPYWSSWCQDTGTAANYTTATYYYSTSVAAENQMAYANWCQDSYNAQLQNAYNQAVRYQYYTQPAPAPKLTAEQKEAIKAARKADEAARLKAQKRAFELRKKKEAAEEKAKEMLLDLIGEDLRADYERTGQVYVQGQRHGYIIKGYGHVKRIEGNGKIRELCIHLQERHKFPDTDNVIALLMALKYDEERFIKTANKHGLYDLSHYEEKQLEAAGMPKDGLKTRLELRVAAPTLGEGIAA